MKSKIVNKKDFKEFQKFMLDTSISTQDERAKIYKKYGNIDPSSKAKYIIEKTGPYIYNLVSKIEEQAEKVDNSGVIEELQNCFSGIKKMLKASEQVSAFETEFKSLNFEENFQELENTLVNHKKDIFKFTNSVFSTIIDDLNNDTPPDLLAFKENITSEEIYDYIVSKNKNSQSARLSQEDYNIGKILIRALDRERSCVNTEIIGRVYAYVKSGWAKSDLYDKVGIKKNENIKELNQVIDSIRENPHGRTQKEKAEDDATLAKSFSNRLSEIAIQIIYKRNEGEVGTCYAKPGNIDPTKVAPAGTADLAILDKNDPSVLHQIYCTANSTLAFTKHNSESSSLLSHQFININNLIGKSLSDIDTSPEDSIHNLKNNLDKKAYTTKIKNVEVVNIAPGLLANNNVKVEMSNIFKKRDFSVSEISTINQFPMLHMILKYKPDNNKGNTVGIEEILNIKENIILNDREPTNAWENLSLQAKMYAHTKEQKEQLFYGRFAIGMAEDLWSIIKNKELKDDYVISNLSENSNAGTAGYFIKELPNMLVLLSKKIKDDTEYKIFSKYNVEKFVKIVDEVLNHPNFMSKASQNTIENDTDLLKSRNEIIKKQFGIFDTNKFRRTSK